MRSVDWMDDAECRDEDLTLFYGPHSDEKKRAREQREAKAKRVCRRCPVRTECLDQALWDKLKGGVWGGLNQDERDTEHRRRLRRKAAA